MEPRLHENRLSERLNLFPLIRTPYYPVFIQIVRNILREHGFCVFARLPGIDTNQTDVVRKSLTGQRSACYVIGRKCFF